MSIFFLPNTHIRRQTSGTAKLASSKNMVSLSQEHQHQEIRQGCTGKHIASACVPAADFLPFRDLNKIEYSARICIHDDLIQCLASGFLGLKDFFWIFILQILSGRK